MSKDFPGELPVKGFLELEFWGGDGGLRVDGVGGERGPFMIAQSFRISP